MNRTGNRLGKTQPAAARPSALPRLPEIPEAYLDRRGVVHLKGADGLERTYEGPIEPGEVFAWEPDIPTARQLVIVCQVDDALGDERRIWTLDLNSPLRGRPDRWKAAMRHTARSFIDGAPTWNDESRFREAVVPTLFNRQTP